MPVLPAPGWPCRWTRCTSTPRRLGSALGLAALGYFLMPFCSTVATMRSAIISLNQMVLPLACGAFGSALGLLPLFWAVATLLGAGGGYAVTRKP